MIVPVENNINRYQTAYPMMLRAVLRGEEITSHLVKAKEEKVESLSDLSEIRKAYIALADEIRSRYGLVSLAREHFQVLKGQLSPCLVINPLLRERAIDQLASQALRDISWKIGQILDDSIFTPGDLRYRTDFVNGKPVIKGEDGSTPLHIAAIAHELGHCHFERSQEDGAKSDILKSEQFAYSTEWQFTYYVLQGRYLEAFKNYWKIKNNLDFYFFFKEAAGLGFFEMEDYCKTSADFFYRPYLFFRETYFTALHYQYIYAKCALGFSA